MLLSSRLLDGLIQLHLPLLDQCFLLKLKLGPQGILAVEFLSQKLVVLLVVLLDVGCKLLSMGDFQCIDGFVVLSEVRDLLFEFLNSLVESGFDVHHLQFHALDLVLVLLLQFFLFLGELHLVYIEAALALLLLSDVLLLEFTDFRFPRISLLSSLDGVFLF